VFSKYAKTRKDALNAADIKGMLKGNRNILDPTGWTAGALEWCVSGLTRDATSLKS